MIIEPQTPIKTVASLLTTKRFWRSTEVHWKTWSNKLAEWSSPVILSFTKSLSRLGVCHHVRSWPQLLGSLCMHPPTWRQQLFVQTRSSAWSIWSLSRSRSATPRTLLKSLWTQFWERRIRLAWKMALKSCSNKCVTTPLSVSCFLKDRMEFIVTVRTPHSARRPTWTRLTWTSKGAKKSFFKMARQSPLTHPLIRLRTLCGAGYWCTR